MDQIRKLPQTIGISRVIYSRKKEPIMKIRNNQHLNKNDHYIPDIQQYKIFHF